MGCTILFGHIHTCYLVNVTIAWTVQWCIVYAYLWLHGLKSSQVHQSCVPIFRYCGLKISCDSFMPNKLQVWIDLKGTFTQMNSILRKNHCWLLWSQLIHWIEVLIRFGETCITSFYRQIWRPDQPMNMIVWGIVGGVNDQNSTVNKCLCRWFGSRKCDKS